MKYLSLQRERREIGFFFGPLVCSTAHSKPFEAKIFWFFSPFVRSSTFFSSSFGTWIFPQRKRKKREKDRREINTNTEYIYKKMVAGEGRPKRACADGIDYAGTDQVPGWTVRVSFLFFAFLFFVCLGTKFQNFSLAPSLSLSPSQRVLFLLFLLLRRRRLLVLLSSRYYSRGWSFIAHRGRWNAKNRSSSY